MPALHAPDAAARTTKTPLSIFAILALVLIATIAAVFLLGNEALRTEAQVTRDQAVIDDLKDSLSTLKDAETGQRGFVLTGNEDYLKPNQIAKSRIESELGRLDARARNQELLESDIAEYRRLTNAKFEELDRTVRLMRESGFDKAAAVVRDNSGKETMDRLRDLTAKMIDTTTRERESHRAKASKIAASRTILFVVGGALDLLILYWAYARITHEIELRTQAAQEAEDQKELLRVTLASIGDGVIVANLEARITFLNSIAERLTGWSLAEAIGEPCAKVFEIVNESSRQRVESPVDKVLSHGIVVGLANHTILIRKDRSEVPIDDSGAPIRDADGKLRGVVLVFRDFSAHKRSQNALHLAMENAQAANIAKDNFLAALSHELRTPLTPVVMTLDAWSSSAEPPANWQRDVEIMRRNLDLEARLIDDLLDLTRIVRGKLSLNFTVADANALLESIASMYQSELLSKKLTLSLDFHAANHFVHVDPARLQQVFLNILKNASKFTAEGGEISLETKDEADKHVSISIRDTGIGMSEETLGKLFHPFEQGSDEQVRRYGGLGLGMAISKALIEAQGGTIQAESAGPGRGSTITISLPTCEPDQASKAIGPKAPQAKQRSLRILLLEDHEDTARALSRLLERWSHQVSAAHTVADALKLVGARDFDLILSDIGLPDGTGIEFIKKVRESRATPAVALTGFGMEDDVNECKLAGFSDHLTKPINFQRLEAVIQAICEAAH